MGNYTVKNILLPTDFSELSSSALQIAIAMCNRHKAKLTLLHVSENDTYMPNVEMFMPTAALPAEIKQENKNKIEALASTLSAQNNIDINGIILLGNPADVICKTAKESQFDLIIMGTHGASGLKEFFIGTNAFRVVKNAPCPVLTIPSGWNKTEFKKIVFPIRFKAGALDKYFYIKTIIGKNRSDLLIVGLAEQENQDSIITLTKLIEQLSNQLYNDNVRYSTILHHTKDFPERIIDEANKYNADLVVITANIDYTIKTYFVGPFAQQIVNHIKRPVLSIRSDLMVQE